MRHLLVRKGAEVSDLSQMFASALPIEVKLSKPKYVLLLFACLGVTAFVVWALTHGQMRSLWPLIIFAVVSSLSAASCVYALCQTRPIVLLDQRGVTVRGWKGCPVAWSEIERAWKFEQHVSAIYSTIAVDYVCMAFKHSKKWRNKQGRIKRKFASYYHARGWGDIYFTTKGMNFEADELVAAIQSHIGGVRLSAPASLVSGAATSDA